VSPVFAHGQLRLYLLTALADGPRHGYEIIRDLEQRFDGLYVPSAGTVYPRLASLEQEGLVVREDDGRKAVYRITDAGRAEVAERRDDVASLQVELERTVRSMAEQVRAQVRGSASDLRRELAAAAKSARRHARDEPARSAQPAHDGRPGRQAPIESAVEQLRAAVRASTRRVWLDPDTVGEVVRVVERASADVLAVIARGQDPTSRTPGASSNPMSDPKDDRDREAGPPVG
jgi:DNA-binding PadR family transcriptional regulator